MSCSFTIRILDWSGARPLAHPVRERVFIEEQRVPRGLEWDGLDDASEHAVACDPEGNTIGTARLLPEGKLGRMAVLRAWRGRGVGAALLTALLERARERGIARVTLHAQTHAAGFYRRFGFSERGGEFSEAGIPHVEMTLELRADRG